MRFRFAMSKHKNSTKQIVNPVCALWQTLKFFIMNTLKNSVQLIGHLGQDPEIVNLESGSKLAKFSIATSDSYKNTEGEKVEDTQWHNIVAWGKTAEIVENYLVKGKQVAVAGKLIHRSYETKEGEKRYITEIKCNELLMLGK
jgi:single-strand DNA-binding protein